jgi:hypothetical protein
VKQEAAGYILISYGVIVVTVTTMSIYWHYFRGNSDIAAFRNISKIRGTLS